MKQILLIALLSLLSLNLSAQTSEEKGLAIAEEYDRRDTGFGDYKADMVMTLRNKKGDESQRYIRIRIMEVDGDGDKSLSIFDRPRDVKGTAMLTYSHALKPDDQWLYLPALKRVKRISSRNKSGPFMGSEFAYEDLSSQEVEKYSYKYIGDELFDGQACFIIERVPAYEYSGYKRQKVWYDKAEYRPLKIVYYDRKGALLKTQHFTGYNQYLDRYWRPDNIHVENHQTGKSTELVWNNYKFGNNLSDRNFDKNTLKRAR